MSNPFSKIEFETQPANLILSGNQVMVKAIYTDLYDELYANERFTYENIPTGFSYIYDVAVLTPAAGDTLVFESLNSSITFTCVGPIFNHYIPNTFFHSQLQSESKEEYIEYLVNFFFAHWEFSERFFIEKNESGFYLTGLNNEPVKITSSSSTGFIAGTVGLPPIIKNFTLYNFVLAIIEKNLIEGEDIYSRSIKIEQSYTPIIDDPDAYFTTDISELLQEEKTGHFTIFLTTQYFAMQDIINFYELKVNNNVIGGTAYSNEFMVLQGKAPDYYLATLNELGYTFFHYWCYLRKFFFTFAPRTKTIDIYMPERLYLYNYDLYQNYFAKIVFTIYYTDNTSETKYINRDESITDVDLQTKILEVNVSFLALPFNTEKTVKSYRVYLAKEDGQQSSEMYYYNVNYNYQRYARYFLFKNRLGVYEVLRTTGKLSAWSNIEKSYVQIDKDINYVSDYRKDKQINVNSTYPVEINTGFIEKGWEEYFLEFLESDDVYWLKKGKAYPVAVQKTKMLIKKDGENINSHTFSLTVTNTDDELYTDFTFDPDVPITGAFSFDFNEGFN